jgi:hypothetical protein
MTFDYKFWLPFFVSLVYLYLNYQQLSQKKGNQHTSAAMTIGSRLKAYWPMLVMVFLFIGCWIPYLLSKEQAVPDIPEFDTPNSAIVTGWAQDTPSSCLMQVNGGALLSRQSGYKLAIACLIYDGKTDILDAPYLQVSNLYDIKLGSITMRAGYQPYFLEYESRMHAVGINIALLNIPNGIQPTQFTTLRQARSMGVKILILSTAKGQS